MPDHNSQEGQGLIKVAVVHALSNPFNDTQLDGLSPIKHAMLSNRATRRPFFSFHGLPPLRAGTGVYAKAGEPGPIKGLGNAHRIEVNRI